MEFISMFNEWFSFAGALFALFAWLQARRTQRDMQAERQRQAQRIAVTLRVAGKEQELRLPLSLRRQELTRAEVLGRLGMLPMREAGKRFSLRHLSTSAFLSDLDAIQVGTATEIVIPATEAEIAQFDL